MDFKKTPKAILFLGLVLGFFSFCLISLLWLPNPFVWIGSFLFIECLVASFLCSPKWKLVPFYLGFLVLPITGFEYYLSKQVEGGEFSISQNGTYLQGYFVKDEILGFGPTPNQVVSSGKYINDKLLYDVKYTILENGLRKAFIKSEANNSKFSQSQSQSQSQNNSDNECILFFGCSMLFGEGLNDEETLPYLIGKKLGINTHNFAFHGYGAHQMLANVNHHLVESKTKINGNGAGTACLPKLSIYMAIPNHVARSRGMSAWDLHGPRFELKQDGSDTVEQVGHFDDARIIPNKVWMQLSRSSLFNRLFLSRKMDEQDFKTYLAMINTTKDNLEKLNPNHQFVVILWDPDLKDDYHQKEFEIIKKGLKDRKIKTILVSELLKGYPDTINDYILHPADKHPNVKANVEMALNIQA